ncbi:MAG: molybdopterin converting factor subunit 1 [Aquificota bacterium]|nr:MAG: molybdopterin converting factor subunit 1 [Aquificota bacterium]
MKLLYFSVVRERLKKEEEEIEFSGSVAQLKELLSKKYPELKPIWERVRFAVNYEYVDEEHVLKGDEQVAVIPPVSGG